MSMRNFRTLCLAVTASFPLIAFVCANLPMPPQPAFWRYLIVLVLLASLGGLFADLVVRGRERRAHYLRQAKAYGGQR